MNDDEILRFLTDDEINAFSVRAAHSGNDAPVRMLGESIARMRVALSNAIKRAREDDEPCPVCQREADEHHTAGCIFLSFPERLRGRP